MRARAPAVLCVLVVVSRADIQRNLRLQLLDLSGAEPVSGAGRRVGTRTRRRLPACAEQSSSAGQPPAPAQGAAHLGLELHILQGCVALMVGPPGRPQRKLQQVRLQGGEGHAKEGHVGGRVQPAAGGGGGGGSSSSEQPSVAACAYLGSAQLAVDQVDVQLAHDPVIVVGQASVRLCGLRSGGVGRSWRLRRHGRRP